LSNEHTYKAKIIGTAPKTDIALIKINPKPGENLTVVKLGDSDKLQVGEWVLAIGNPFGFSRTVTAGIVSAKGRVIGEGPYDAFIQTDAAINPGNSGGPLVNLKGEVVGINTAIIAAAQGIGFAIPINMAKFVVEQLKSKGYVQRGWLGVYIQPVSKDLADYFGMKEPHGALVADVVKDGPAYKAGIKRGDIIVEFNGKKVKNTEELPKIVASTPINKEVKVVILRERKKMEVKVKIGEMPESKTEASVKQTKTVDKLGLRVSNPMS
jgi:serine protease Do